MLKGCFATLLLDSTGCALRACARVKRSIVQKELSARGFFLEHSTREQLCRPDEGRNQGENVTEKWPFFDNCGVRFPAYASENRSRAVRHRIMQIRRRALASSESRKPEARVHRIPSNAERAPPADWRLPSIKELLSLVDYRRSWKMRMEVPRSSGCVILLFC